MTATDDPHSQLYFTDVRDHWWNDDYLALVSRRFTLASARRVLDVGAGQGHFARAFAPHLAPDAEIVCLDPESRSLAVAADKCAAWSTRTGARTQFSFVVGRIESLPFEDDGFDLVMGQTVLIHLRAPEHALAEMIRVTRPGGRVLSAEPNNFGSAQRLALHGPEADPDDAMREFRFHALCIRGKTRLGEGWNNLGALLPKLFAGLDDVRYFQCDRPWVMAPPYDEPVQRAAIEDLRTHVRDGVYGWHREDARRYFVAGGGDPAGFDAEYDAGLARQRAEFAAIEAGAWFELDGVIHFIASGRKRGG